MERTEVSTEVASSSDLIRDEQLGRLQGDTSAQAGSKGKVEPQVEKLVHQRMIVYGERTARKRKLWKSHGKRKKRAEKAKGKTRQNEYREEEEDKRHCTQWKKGTRSQQEVSARAERVIRLLDAYRGEGNERRLSRRARQHEPIARRFVSLEAEDFAPPALRQLSAQS
eukprot:6208524-Pleurochrysis_carterae.AAC.3